MPRSRRRRRQPNSWAWSEHSAAQLGLGRGATHLEAVEDLGKRAAQAPVDDDPVVLHAATLSPGRVDRLRPDPRFTRVNSRAGRVRERGGRRPRGRCAELHEDPPGVALDGVPRDVERVADLALVELVGGRRRTASSRSLSSSGAASSLEVGGLRATPAPGAARRPGSGAASMSPASARAAFGLPVAGRAQPRPVPEGRRPARRPPRHGAPAPRHARAAHRPRALDRPFRRASRPAARWYAVATKCSSSRGSAAVSAAHTTSSA